MNAVLSAQVEILPLGHGDVDEMLAVEKGVYAFPWTRGNFVDSIVAGYSVWGCRVAGDLVGYFVVMLALDEAHLLNLSVTEKRQGMGFGALLLRHAMQSARRAGAVVLLLEVRRSNTRALALYEHFGFQQIGVRRDYYAAALGREDALVLQHVLEEVSG
ncbi:MULTISPECIES: ribosomal protein S18-alanine N-acetyltransferase [unclassified Candidatus Accumulibacter]|uniref:ribosomal protein S18-alanine N-acetyltransferase n=1 Tax=unclassified Candidatus Accumulibacter TaxID=2619054 RepID=UPI0004BC4C49|nr:MULTISPECIES: ribosomal protein S18-alanine N-acetyltransferase [unclassified Candidatus Accumulibacter]HRE70575.1 ribosomal protein S18-alanine N-acetyltransferase [Accumulibacter sp.]HRE86996.1 ribosomal protein S18-alanine N-acetyltransferase [Accumulibacter sp.]HRI92618.1 ribosomal protein S18-alanine N-acetyltransferase [Accumulibacter sp.]